MICVNAGIDLVQLNKAARSQCGADEQRNRDGDLSDDQQSAQPTALRPGTAGAILECAEERADSGQARP